VLGLLLRGPAEGKVREFLLGDAAGGEARGVVDRQAGQRGAALVMERGLVPGRAEVVRDDHDPFLCQCCASLAPPHSPS
jgi:hypothetical protein